MDLHGLWVKINFDERKKLNKFDRPSPVAGPLRIEKRRLLFDVIGIFIALLETTIIRTQ